LQAIIPREGEHAKKAFVQFADVAGAGKAFESLNGRSFANNVVKVSYIQESEMPADSS
jgi:RNA recognition motif-containing protein